MKILLTVPMNRPLDQVSPMNDNGLGYIAATCKKAGAEVKLQSWNINLNLEAFRQNLLEFRPDIVGIKVFTSHFNSTYETLTLIRETLPNTIILIGGPHPSTSRPADLFHEFGGILDYAIAGDGEFSMKLLIQKLYAEGGKPNVEILKDVPGLIYRHGNKIYVNKPYFDADLDSLPQQDWSLQQPGWFTGFNSKTNEDKILISDSRGCPARCGHCMSWDINGTKPRKRNLELLVDEIHELILKYDVHYIDFTGNSFLSDTDYLMDLCHRLIELDSPLRWNCTGAAFDRNLLNPKLLDLMKSAGCHAIHFGIETGNPDVLKRINKPLSLQEYSEILKLTTKAGIKTLGYFMFGFPDETVKEMEDSIRYALSQPFHSFSFQICLPFPGTSNYNSVLEKKGLERIDWSTYNFLNPNLLPCKASLAQIRLKLLETKVLRRSKIARRLFQLLR